MGHDITEQMLIILIKCLKDWELIRAKIGPTSDVDKISQKCIHNMIIMYDINYDLYNP
jgi:hypothetical protein